MVITFELRSMNPAANDGSFRWRSARDSRALHAPSVPFAGIAAICREIRARRLDGRRVEISQTRGATHLQPC